MPAGSLDVQSRDLEEAPPHPTLGLRMPEGRNPFPGLSLAPPVVAP
jgi:hypothetical protein